MTLRPAISTAIIAAIALTGACGDAVSTDDAGIDGVDTGLCGVAGIVRFDPGTGAGFGADALPDIVTGPPSAVATSQGSLDVVSLGVGGEIVLELDCEVEDGDGVDVVVYENAFFVGAAGSVFAEAGEVAVSKDGLSFHTFPCTPSTNGPAVDDGVDGCAGLAPVAANADNGLAGVFPDGGGDGFDLATVGLSSARFVRVRDVSTAGASPNAGFDLDAIVARVR